MSEPLTQERLRELFVYNHDTGEFVSRKRGTVCGSLTRKGAVKMTIDGKFYQAHRLAWLYMTGAWPKDQIDHINRKPADNRFCNLRDVGPLEQRLNQHKMLDRPKHWLGTTRTKWGWQATIEFATKNYYLGLFERREDAHAAYMNARKRLVAGEPCP